MSAARIDCSDFDFGLCQEIVAYRLRPDGILTGRRYSYAQDTCRFRTHPRWHDRPYGVELPSD